MLKNDGCNCIYARSRTVRNLMAVAMAAVALLVSQSTVFAQDDCATATVAVDGANAYDTTGSTLDATAPAPVSPNMTTDIWFSYTASCTGTLTVETCEAGTSLEDTIIELHEGSVCPPAAAFAGNDDACGGGSGFASQVTIFVDAGDEILIRLSGWNGGVATGTMDISCVAGPLPACCVGDGTCAELSTTDCFANPDGVIFTDGTVCADLTDECELQACCAADLTCSEISSVLCGLLGGTPLGTGSTCATASCAAGACCDTSAMCTDVADEATCMASGGNFQGVGTTCATTTCPTVQPNDNCAGAIGLAIPSTTTGSTVGQNPETIPTCGTTDGTGGALWYSVIGDGTTLTISTCNAGTNYDTKLRVFTDGCATLTCVGGNDDSPNVNAACVIPETGSTANRASTFSWCSANGVEYLILVHGFAATEGNFELSLSSDGIACVQACCLADGTCQDLGVDQCTAAGGTSQGPGSDCATATCEQPQACCLPNGNCVENFVADCTGLGGTPQGEGRLCVDVTCPAPSCACGTVINTFPYTENFEADEPPCSPGAGTTGCGLVCALVGDWENRANGLFDDTDMLTDQGGTPSTGVGTGPTVDATTGTATGNYAYLETSGACGSGVAQLISPCFDLTGTSAPAFSMAYHMRGGDIGTLTVEVTSDSCQNFTQEFTISGEQSPGGADWLTQLIDLTAYRGLPEVRILITASGGGGFESDIAIDDLVVFDDGSTGACCDAVGCTDGISLTACAGLGGIYQGDGTTCAMTDCLGACCAGDGTCTDVTEVACDAAGGDFQGNGTDCATTDCAGACCILSTGTCIDTGPDGCATAGGNFQGLGTDCASTVCPVNGADDCIDPLPEAFDGANPVDLTGATSSGLLAPTCAFPVAPADVISNDLFFQYTATCSGVLFVDTCGNSFDSRLAIYEGDCAAVLGGADPIDCNDDHADGDGNTCAATLSASLSINATMGTTYVIRVGSFTAAATTGMFDLNIACVPGAECDSCSGDVNGDTLIDGNDIQTFVDCYTTEFGMAPSAACACADVVDDQLIDMNDLSALITALLSKPSVCDPGACCFFDGATMCTVTSNDICDALGGDFTAGGDCSGDPCPVGRCCSNGGLTCDDVSEVECASIGGTFDAGLDCTNDPCPIPPPNDDCIDAIVAVDGSNPYSTVNATLDASGPAPFDANLTEDIWFVYTATCDGDLTIDTCEFDLLNNDTVLEVHDGSTCPPAAVGADRSSDDDCGSGSGFASTVTIVGVTTGQEFLIRLSGWNGSDETGLLEITCVAAGGPEACCFADGSCSDLTPVDCGMMGGTNQGIGTVCATTSCPQPPPANDDCDNAIAVTTGPNAGQANNSSAGADLVEASCQANSNGDVWFVWTADCDGNASIDTEGSVFTTSNDTVLSIYSTSCGGAEVACDDDGGSGLLSTTTFPVLTGEVYYIRVAGFGTNTGDVNINIACASNAMEACCFPDGSCTDEVVGDCAGLGGIGQGGGTDCGSVSCPQPPPANDDCANATDLTDGDLPFSDIDVSLSTATNDTNVDVSCDIETGFAATGVWYTYTPASNCLLSVVVAGSDTAQSVWTGPDCNTLTEEACSDPQTLTYEVAGGTTYYILVSDWSDSSLNADTDITISCGPIPEGACCMGDGSCTDGTESACDTAGGVYQGDGTDCGTTTCPIAPANDDCANAIEITIGGVAMGNTDAATPDGLGTCGTSAGTNGAVWYYVTGDGTTLTADLCGSPFDTKIQIYEDGCGTLTCVTGEDDDFTNCGENDPSVDWCAANGVEYLIAVQGFSTGTGDYTLTVTSDLTPCP